MPDQRELPLAFPELSPETPFIPVRMVNEFVYCPRLAYLEWVQGEFRAQRGHRRRRHQAQAGGQTVRRAARGAERGGANPRPLGEP